MAAMAAPGLGMHNRHVQGLPASVDDPTCAVQGPAYELDLSDNDLTSDMHTILNEELRGMRAEGQGTGGAAGLMQCSMWRSAVCCS